MPSSEIIQRTKVHVNIFSGDLSIKSVKKYSEAGNIVLCKIYPVTLFEEFRRAFRGFLSGTNAVNYGVRSRQLVPGAVHVQHYQKQEHQ